MPLDAAAVAPEKLRPLKREEYDRLVEMGAFEDERVELLEGQLVAMSPQGEDHADVTAVLGALLTRRLGDRALVRQHSPFALSESSEPEPDIAVVPWERSAAGHPDRSFLLVEVADSSLKKDRSTKTNLYAEGNVPEYWIVDVQSRLVEVYRTPEQGHYTELRTVRAGERLSLQAFPDIELSVSELFRG